jgi:hypothetical protein
MNPFEQFEDWVENLPTPVVFTEELKQEIIEKAKELINW